MLEGRNIAGSGSPASPHLTPLIGLNDLAGHGIERRQPAAPNAIGSLDDLLVKQNLDVLIMDLCSPTGSGPDPRENVFRYGSLHAQVTAVT